MTDHVARDRLEVFREPEGFAYHTPDCAITAEDNCTCDLYERLEAVISASPAPGLPWQTVADAFHDALCDVSHHDSREVYAASQGTTQPCRVKYDRIAATLAPPAALVLREALREAYTLLVSAEPTLIRDAKTGPNPTSLRYKAMLRDKVGEWLDPFRDAFDEQAAILAATPGLPAELRALSEKATPGPWYAPDSYGEVRANAGPDHFLVATIGTPEYERDSDLIAAAVNYVRALAATPDRPAAPDLREADEALTNFEWGRDGVGLRVALAETPGEPHE
jgi:hypothetical protein